MQVRLTIQCRRDGPDGLQPDLKRYAPEPEQAAACHTEGTFANAGRIAWKTLIHFTST